MGQTRVLVTGGAGFIGGHVVERLLAEGYQVTILDSLVEQVHGPDPDWPTWTREQIEADGLGIHTYRADVRDREALRSVLESMRPHVVVHLAAEVGVGQAEVEIERYVDANVRGTAVLLEEILRANDSAEPDDAVRRVVVAGSMSSYGEGLWECPEHGPQRAQRAPEDLTIARWTPRCAIAGDCIHNLSPVPVAEWNSLRPAGVYAATKRDQEEYALLVARSSGLSVAVCRFFNVYGPRQALRNPYTGVCAIFAARALSGLAPRVYEDGGQLRDFVHVTDAAAAVTRLCGHANTRIGARWWAAPTYQGVFNVGSGVPVEIGEIARLASEVFGAPAPEVTGLYRVGDVRACYAETGPLAAIGWAPSVSLDDGLRELFEGWRGEDVSDADLDADFRQLSERRLLLAVGTDPAAEEDEEDEEDTGSAWG